MIADSKAALQANFSNMDEIINKIYLIADDFPVKVEDLYKKIANSMDKKLFLINIPSKFLKVLLWPLGKAKLVDKISTSLIVDNTDIKNDTHWKDNSSFLEELNNMIEFRKSKL